jgi:hypothetical protein
MFVPTDQAQAQDLHRAIFDYLNLNRHKFNRAGEFDPDADGRDFMPARLARDRPGPPSEHIEGQDGTTRAKQTLAKASACAVEALPELAAAGALLGLGAPTIRKRFVTPKSARRTSIASKYLAPLIPGEFPMRVWTPRPGNAKPMAKSIGRAVARWIPGVGWALLAHAAYRFADCMLRDEQAGSAGT